MNAWENNTIRFNFTTYAEEYIAAKRAGTVWNPPGGLNFHFDVTLIEKDSLSPVDFIIVDVEQASPIFSITDYMPGQDLLDSSYEINGEYHVQVTEYNHGYSETSYDIVITSTREPSPQPSTPPTALPSPSPSLVPTSTPTSVPTGPSLHLGINLGSAYGNRTLGFGSNDVLTSESTVTMDLSFTGQTRTAQPTIRLCKGDSTGADPCGTLVSTLYVGSSSDEVTGGATTSVEISMPDASTVPAGTDYFIVVYIIDSRRRRVLADGRVLLDTNDGDGTTAQSFFTGTFTIAPFDPSSSPTQARTRAGPNFETRRRAVFGAGSRRRRGAPRG